MLCPANALGNAASDLPILTVSDFAGDTARPRSCRAQHAAPGTDSWRDPKYCRTTPRRRAATQRFLLLGSRWLKSKVPALRLDAAIFAILGRNENSNAVVFPVLQRMANRRVAQRVPNLKPLDYRNECRR